MLKRKGENDICKLAHLGKIVNGRFPKLNGLRKLNKKSKLRKPENKKALDDNTKGFLNSEKIIQDTFEVVPGGSGAACVVAPSP